MLLPNHCKVALVTVFTGSYLNEVKSIEISAKCHE